MTRREAEAFNAGVPAVLALARATSDRLALQVVDKPTRFNFAIGALDGLAEDGAALLLPASAKRMLDVGTHAGAIASKV